MVSAWPPCGGHGAARSRGRCGTCLWGEADRLAVGRPLGWWQEWLRHPDPDDRYWQRLDYASATAKARVPVLMVTSWHDLFLPWQLADWTRLPASATPRRLVIAPWVHEDPKLFKLYVREALAWLDAQVRGDGNSLAGGPVRYYLTGAEQWRDAAAWPPPGTVQRHWFLQPGGGCRPLRPSLRHQAATATTRRTRPPRSAVRCRGVTRECGRTRSRRARTC